jgi:hypothetical protein
MKDKFTVDFDHLTQTLLPRRSYRLADVVDRIEKVAYDLVRFRDNADTDQLWKIEEGVDGPVIVALYGDEGELKTAESSLKQDWEAIPDKTSMHIFYKGEPIVSLSSDDLGIPVDEFGIARRWLPRKLETDHDFQKILLSKAASGGRELIAQRFPELEKTVSNDLGMIASYLIEEFQKLGTDLIDEELAKLEEEDDDDPPPFVPDPKGKGTLHPGILGEFPMEVGFEDEDVAADEDGES